MGLKDVEHKRNREKFVLLLLRRLQAQFMIKNNSLNIENGLTFFKNAFKFMEDKTGREIKNYLIEYNNQRLILIEHQQKRIIQSLSLDTTNQNIPDEKLLKSVKALKTYLEQLSNTVRSLKSSSAVEEIIFDKVS